MPSDVSSRPDLPIEIKLLRVKHYVAVYNLALEVTGTFSAAKELTERVFDNAAHRFENQPIPQNCDKYLAAQVYLIYAQKDSPVFSSAAEDSEASTEPGTTDFTRESGSTTAKATPNTIKPSPQKEMFEPVLNVEAAILGNAFADGMPKSAATGTQPAPAKALDKNDEPVIDEAIYDKKRTEFWTPDSDTRCIQLNDVAPDETPETEEEVDKPSVVLSILNAFLVIASLVSIAFLVYQMNVSHRFW